MLSWIWPVVINYLLKPSMVLSRSVCVSNSPGVSLFSAPWLWPRVGSEVSFWLMPAEMPFATSRMIAVSHRPRRICLGSAMRPISGMAC